jgi:hypothetical protein
MASICTSQIDAKFVHGFWICQIEVVSIVGFSNLVFSLHNEITPFIFLSSNWIMQKYPMHFKLIRIIIKDAHKNEGSLKIIIIWIVRIVEKQKV